MTPLVRHCNVNSNDNEKIHRVSKLLTGSVDYTWISISGAHPAPARDLLSLHQAGPSRDVALQARDCLLTPQRHRLHAGHVLPLLQVDPTARKRAGKSSKLSCNSDAYELQCTIDCATFACQHYRNIKCNHKFSVSCFSQRSNLICATPLQWKSGPFIDACIAIHRSRHKAAQIIHFIYRMTISISAPEQFFFLNQMF